MFPTLGHLINYIFGTDINFPLPTYGFMLVLAFATAYLILRLEFKRREKAGLLESHKITKKQGGQIKWTDILISLFFGFIIGAKFIGIIIDYDEFAKDIHKYIFSMKGSFIGGFISGLLLAANNYYSELKNSKLEKKEFKVEVHPYQIATNIVLVAAFSGIIGAKLFDIFDNFSEFLKDPLAQLLNPGGFTFFGGLIVGTISVAYYCKKKNISLLQMMDSAGPAILAAYAVGRMACMLSGDGCWGIPNPEPKPEFLAFLPDWMWAYDFPHNVIKEGVPIHNCGGDYCYKLDVPVFPTPFYETSLNAIMFGILWSIRKKIQIPGVIFSIALIMNGFIRFFIEKIRVNIKYDFIGMQITQAEIISTILVILGIIGIFYFRNKHLKKA
jgi:prolipoprotein diacylglyceryl transferase